MSQEKSICYNGSAMDRKRQETTQMSQKKHCTGKICSCVVYLRLPSGQLLSLEVSRNSSVGKRLEQGSFVVS